MSEGDPYKRLKTTEEEEEEVKNSDDSTLIYQNACLSTRLKDQRKQISELKNENDLLCAKVNKLEENLNSFNCNWAKVRST